MWNLQECLGFFQLEMDEMGPYFVTAGSQKYIISIIPDAVAHFKSIKVYCESLTPIQN